jgi:NAD(P)H-dependent FMN reductase/methylphosphotriester-DNA--protein-cysteine methyltransferase
VRNSARVLFLVGSLRLASHNRTLAEAAVKLAPAGFAGEIYQSLADLPFYNEDFDTPGAPPAAVGALRGAIGGANAVVLVTPEYNGTMSAALKNAIDWLSSPPGSGALAGKPLAVIGASSADHGGLLAQGHARAAARAAGAAIVESVVIAVPHAATRFAQTHPADDSEVRESLAALYCALAREVRIRPGIAANAADTSGDGGPEPMPAAVLAALALMRARHTDSLTVSHIASEVHLSVYHFIRVFRDATGRTPGQYLTCLRIERAKQMLVISSHSVDRIAARCGFSSAASLSSAFLAHVGVRPSVYRKNSSLVAERS